jgi:predicted PurR-regulated permease PerM
MPHWVRWLWLTIALLAVLYMTWRLLGLVLMVAIALLLTAALVPIVAWLDARRVPHGLSVAACFLGLIGLVVGVMLRIGPMMADQARELAGNLTGLSANYQWVATHWAGWRRQFGMLPDFAEMSAILTSQFQGSLEALIGLTGQFLTVAIGTFAVLFLAFFFVKDGTALQTQLLSLLPAPRRADAHEVLTRVRDRVGRYVLGVLVNMTLVGTLTGIGLSILGVPYAAVLGLLVGVLDIIPFLGPFLGAFPGVVVAFSHSWQMGLWAIAIYWGVQQLESYLTYPNVVGRATRLHPAWIFIALLAGGELLGVAGMVLAVPLMVVLQIVMQEWYLPWVQRHRTTPALTTPEAPQAVRFSRPAWGDVKPVPPDDRRPVDERRPPGSGTAM